MTKKLVTDIGEPLEGEEKALSNKSSYGKAKDIAELLRIDFQLTPTQMLY